MRDDLPAFVGALVSDVVGAIGLPSNSAGLAIQKLLERRLRNAAEIALEQLKRGAGSPDMLDLEATAAMLFRYLRAAQEGAARINLRLMAKVIAGQRQNATLTADEFLYHAEILAQLRREEIILLGTLFRHWEAEANEVDRTKRNSTAISAAKKELIPNVMGSNEEFTATMAAITRTGLLIPESAFGGIVYQVSPLMSRLNDLAPFEAALDEEGKT